MGKLKYFTFTLIVIVVETGLAYLVSQMTGLYLLDAMFYLGIACCATFIYFSSSGGMVANKNEAMVAASILGSKSNYSMKRSPFSLRLNPLVFGSIVFFVLGFVLAALF
ncbi:hypothetical protein JOC85_001087 [Bacillus mesophilus]|uniref:DUF3899 domain-containing protein n=1 Tax=Bacillus mesophilus TaxID=1808955 RepID=A0A6M0Q467_9BACI|nr:hypothetical protein [Bacillus mesophilus]MBM7660320.1 hypothetical protein [Bacillus mesophilus]NEY71032.1 hypothetical protein [Bacillus mesophilus]